MPRYEYDPSKTSAVQEIFPKDDYEIVVGEPKSFIRKNRKNEDSYGVRFMLTIDEGQYKGKKLMYTCYLHTEGSQSMTKRFQMAVFGFKNKAEDEKAFDAATAGLDWAFDPETGTCGEAWHKMAGAHVIAGLDIDKNKETDEPTQGFKSWRPAIGQPA